MLDRSLYKIIKQTQGKTSFKKYPLDFPTRIIIQKTLYFLTHGRSNPKIKLPYKWTFYLRGPYSSEIAHMIYHMNNFRNDIEKKSYELSEEDINAISHFQGFKKDLDITFKKDIDTQKISEGQLFEVLATLTYIALQVGNDKVKLFEKLIEFKPGLKEKLTDAILDEIYEILLKHAYI